jgi:hypothetical protein
MVIYGWEISERQRVVEWPLVATAYLAAFIGAYAGSKVLQKVTIRSVQLVVSVLLVVVSLGLMSGVL